MKTRTRQALLGLTAIALVGAAGIAGTFAYLSDTSEEVVNTFEANRVEVDLIESKLDEDGNIIPGTTSKGNNYDIVPGTTATKDPQVQATVTLPSYVFVEINDVVNLEGKKLVDYTVDSTWTQLEGYDNVYYREIEKSDKEYVPVLKDNTITYPASLTNEDLATLTDENNTLTFKASAIQKEPFNDPVRAYMIANPVTVTDLDGLQSVIKNGGAAVLTENIEITEALTISEETEVILDLNGKTIISSVTDGTRPIVNYGTLVVTGNGTIDNTKVENGYGAIRNYGDLTIESGTFKANDLSGGSAIDTWEDGTTTINGGTYYATAAVMNREGGTTIINGGDFEGVSNANEKYNQKNYSYAIRNYGEMTINGGTVHGSMNGGIACDQGTITINDGNFKVEPTGTSAQTFYVVVTTTGAQVVINGGTFEQTNGTDRLLGGFSGMPSWDATEDLEANGYTINGGTFILNGTTVTIGDSSKTE